MRHAFTLIEVLVVIAIMALLAAMILTGANALGIGSKKAKTAAILTSLRSGMDLAQIQSGLTFSPVEHPLAGSRPQRSIFIGIRGRTWDAVNRVATGGARVAILDQNGEAIKGLAEWQLGDPVSDLATRKRVLMDDDLFADPMLPLLYGANRSSCRVLGGEFSACTRYRDLPKPRPPALQLTAPSYTSADFPDARFLNVAGATATDTEIILSRLFDASGMRSELENLKALSRAPDDLPANRILPPAALGAGADDNGRVWSPEPGPAAGMGYWEPGRVLDGSRWKKYRLRSLAVYDAWGREVLCSFLANGGLVLISAGPDGCLRWNPGVDRTFQTAADASAISGDDKDGSRDNVTNQGR